MICKYDGQTRYLKYVNPTVGTRAVYQRFEGEWFDWGKISLPSGYQRTGDGKLRITDRGAILKEVIKFDYEKDYPDANLFEGDQVLRHVRYILDFEFVTRKVEHYLTRMNGTLVLKNQNSENPKIQNWTCELRETPDSKSE